MSSIMNVFDFIVNISLVAAYIAVAVILIRFLLKKSPKVFSYAIWGIVFIKLLIPVSIESDFSIFSGINEPSRIESYSRIIQSEVVENEIIVTEKTETEISIPQPVKTGIDYRYYVKLILLILYAVGVMVLVLHSLFSYMKVKRLIKSTTLIKDNIYQGNNITSPFVFGIFKPKIYLPDGLDGLTKQHIIKHERIHIRRCDYLIKILCYVAVIIHWFNPLVWLSFFLMSKDMEMSCDESVIRSLGKDTRASYAHSLLAFAVGKESSIKAAPLAFMESNTKSRIKNVVNYKKPSFWIIIICVVVLAGAGVCLLTYAKDTIEFNVEYADIEKIEIYDISAQERELLYRLNSDENEYEMKEFAELFNSSKKYTADAGAEQQKLTAVTFKDGKVLELRYGAEGFITVGSEGDLFNIKNKKLENMMNNINIMSVKLISSDFDTDKVQSISIIYGKSGFHDISIKLEKEQHDKEIKKIIKLLDTKSTPYKSEIEKIQLNSVNIQVNGWFYLVSFNDEYLTYVGEILSSQFNENKEFITVKNDELIAYFREILDKNYNELAVLIIPEGPADYEAKIHKLINTIMSSPAYSSNSEDYIAAHRSEYEEIISMGFNALKSINDILNREGLTLEHHIAGSLAVDILKYIYSKDLNVEERLMFEEAEKIMIQWQERNTNIPIVPGGSS